MGSINSCREIPLTGIILLCFGCFISAFHVPYWDECIYYGISCLGMAMYSLLMGVLRYD